MSTIFNKFKKSIDKGVATVSVKSNSMIEINKIKVHMDSLTDRIARKKVELGETVFNLYLEDIPNDEVVESLSEEIIELSNQLEEREKEIQAIKEEEEEILGSQDKTHLCSCGNQVPEGYSFCTKCGAKVE